MKNLLDERIDHYRNMDWKYVHGVVRAPIPTYRRYHRPIDSPALLECNRSIAADSVGRARLKKTGLAAPLACQEENDEYYR